MDWVVDVDLATKGRRMSSNFVVPFVDCLESVVVSVLSVSFGRGFVVSSGMVKRGKAWSMLVKVGKKEVIVFEGFEGREWMTFRATLGISKNTRVLMAKKCMQLRKEFSGFELSASLALQERILRKVGEEWRVWTDGRKNTSWRLRLDRALGSVLVHSESFRKQYIRDLLTCGS